MKGVKQRADLNRVGRNLYPHLTQKTMLVWVLHSRAKTNASPKLTSSADVGGTSWTCSRWDAEAWRWTTNAARPSSWEPLSKDPWMTGGWVKKLNWVTRTQEKGKQKTGCQYRQVHQDVGSNTWLCRRSQIRCMRQDMNCVLPSSTVTNLEAQRFCLEIQK